MKILKVTFLAIVIVAFAGCVVSAPFIEAADTFVNETVGPEYLTYVENDPALNADEVRYRQENVATFRAAVEAAKNVGSN